MASRSDFKPRPEALREEAEGLAQRAKGKIKESAGKLLGDELLKREGRIEKTVGGIRHATNDVIGPDNTPQKKRG